jgi:hypothetical protein
VNADEFCRTIEAYLTRKNDGHLIRIVGPSFERVRGWAESGIPLKIVFAGVDRYFDRYYAKGPRRRPVRIDFCEADILDVFDEWRRAVGLAAGRTESVDGGASRERKTSLTTHLERSLARLVALRAGGAPPVSEAVLADVVAEVDRLMSAAHGARGEARQSILSRLQTLDGLLLSAARDATPAETIEALRADAVTDLRPFADRMPHDTWEKALAAAIDRAIRERARLPILSVD